MIFGREFSFIDHGSILTAGFLFLKILTWHLYPKHPIHFFCEIMRMSISLKTHQKWGKAVFLAPISYFFA
jgi:hypothetical protein